MTEIVFHLGDPKTGSTSIQHTLAAGGCHAPGLSLLYSAPINHLPLAKTLLAKGGEPEFRQKRFRKLRRQINEARPDVAVVSAELFERVEPQALAEAIAEFLPAHRRTARLIAYVRPHADRIVSTYAERIKQGHFRGTMEELHQRTQRRDRFLYAPRFNRWREVFGERFTLRPMIRERLKGQDVVQDFLDFALKGAAFEVTGARPSNESLCLEDLAMLREAHLLLVPEERRGKALDIQASLGWAFSRMLSERPRASRTRLRMARGLAAEVMEMYAADAATLDAEFFDGTPMSDALAGALDRAVETPQSVLAEDHFDAAELRDLRAWAGLVAEMLRSDPEGYPLFFRREQRMVLRAAAAGNAAQNAAQNTPETSADAAGEDAEAEA